MPEDDDEAGAAAHRNEGKVDTEPVPQSRPSAPEPPPAKHVLPAAKRQRPKAEDMFADSDGE